MADETTIDLSLASKRTRQLALQTKAQSLEESINEALRPQQEYYLKPFNTLRACLEILLDDSKLEIAIAKDEIFKELIGAYMQSFDHIQDESSISEAVKTLDSIRLQIEGGDVPQKDSRAVVEGLLQAVRPNDDYFDKNETSTEDIIDKHIEQTLANRSQDGSTGTEIDILLDMFEKLNPLGDTKN